MPIEAHHLDRSIVRWTEMAGPRPPDDPQKKTDSDDHVQRVQACQTPVEHHEQLDFRRKRGIFIPCEMQPGEQSFVPVRVVLVTLDTEEYGAKKERRDQ